MEVDLPKLCIEPSLLSDFERAIQREWVVTNGLGGYASSTILGINTRKYHGLLVSAFDPPIDRRVLLTKFDEEIEIENRTYPLGSNEFRSETYPKGYEFLSRFALRPFPTYEYSINEVQLLKTVFMPHGKSAAIVIYKVHNPTRSEVLIRISPLVNSRHFHSVTDKDELAWSFVQRPAEHEVIIKPSIPLSTLIIFSNDGQYVPSAGDWIEEMYFRVDGSRGESCLDDCFRPGYFKLQVASEERKKFFVLAVAGRDETEAKAVLSSMPRGLEEIETLHNRELNRRGDLLRRFQERHRDTEMKDWLSWLILATDSFIVNRESTRKKSIIAGYHWFEDWGRDALISLPGLTLVTDRFEDAKAILLTFKRYCHKGLVPNRFPDRTGDRPDYNTVDATLWYINAVFQFLKYTGDFAFVREELWGTLQLIIDHHIEGTLHKIGMDDDGLIVHGPQLTWMDAMTDGSSVTPREGKAVEIQALWYNALRVMDLLARRFDLDKKAGKYSDLAERARNAFLEEFWNPQEGCLFDVVNGEKKGSSLRPNQIVAVSLDFSMLEKAKSESVVEIIWKRLWTTHGLRTLPPNDANYIGKYLGDWNDRNRAYHSGTIWPWLVGPFTTAFLKVKNYEDRWGRFAFKTFIQPLFQHEIHQAGLGTVSEIFDGDPPHLSRGCIAQAWSVAEPLRALVEDVLLKRPPHERQILASVGK
ncbi:MAG: glycogen debranching enzyme N-terminal domain-containing protein [Candidatus Bathyarchaeota archaeon]|nr:MAG: glycogen debranching enzyme N-terminal domain-containing protein [Candidatus Bathyarchaeota archaeon]